MQHTRVRLAARAVVDLALHRGEMSLDEAAAFFAARGLMPPATARAEAIKASMFPGDAADVLARHPRSTTSGVNCGSVKPGAPSLREFHDRFLSYGAIPVPLIARLMTRPPEEHEDTMKRSRVRDSRGHRHADPILSWLFLRAFVPSWRLCLRLWHRRPRRGRSGPSNELLIVGYDREPDTLNRFSTHILEDIQTCVIEGLTITDDKMNIVPLLATRSRRWPTAASCCGRTAGWT